MAYRFEQGEGSVEKAVRRIAQAELDKATARIDGDRDRAEAVHDVRLCCKKLRALLRLVHPAFADYRRENAALRDIARLLSASRDARVMQDCWGMLASQYAEEVAALAPATAEALGRVLAVPDDADAEAADAAGALGECRARLAVVRKRAAAWRLEREGWHALSGGLAETYRQARKAARQAHKTQNAAAYHELRKQLKYHLYHTRLFSGLWPEAMGVRAAAGKQATDLLGQHHDLCVFEARIAGAEALFAPIRDVDAILNLVRRRRLELERQAWPLAGRLLAQTPKALADHWHALWAVWREDDGN